MDKQSLVQLALDLGASKAVIIPQEKIVLSAEFRKICEGNGCGRFKSNWMCSPTIGDIETLMAKVRSYKWGLWYQLIGDIEDSYDFEGMMQAGQNHNRIAKSLRTVFEKAGISNPLHLGAGGCRVCGVCAKRTGEPCRHPDLAMSSLEAYGINVSRLAPAADMKYINGNNTVTYFGAVFFRF